MKKEEIEKAYQTIKNGGLAIIPSRVGYTLIGHSEDSIRKMFRIKGRPFHKPCVVLTKREMLHELAEVPKELEPVIEEINSKNMLCGYILPRKNHPFFNSLEEWTNSFSQYEKTSCFVVNGGQYFDHLVKRATEDGILLVGSSANKSGTGNEGVFENIPCEIRENVDFALEDNEFVSEDYNPKTREQGVMIDWYEGHPRVTRRGLRFGDLKEIFERHTGKSLLYKEGC